MTYAVQLTGKGVGAIAVVLLAGERALAIVGGLAASAKVKEMAVGEVIHTKLIEMHGGQAVVLDDGLVVRAAADRIELHLHGGIAVVEAILAALSRAGATVISPEQARETGLLGEGIRGEVMLALPQAATITGARLLAAQIDGGLNAWCRQWMAWLDGREELWRLQSAAQWILQRSGALARLLDPARIAIIGAPNAGKSTLANALLGRPVSITSDIAGTTRDWVDAHAIFPGDQGIQVPIVLVDTAGIRETADSLEQESISRTHQQARCADVIILLLDATRLPTENEHDLMDHYPDHAVVVAVNKMDAADLDLNARGLGHALGISAKKRQGLEQLMVAVLRQLDLASVDDAEPFAFSARQRALLEQVAIARDAAAARALLASLVGAGH